MGLDPQTHQGAQVIRLQDHRGRDKRRFPRRRFEKPVGLLFMGAYSYVRARELSEGGMSILSQGVLKVGDEIVCSLMLPNGGFVIARGVVIYDRNDYKSLNASPQKNYIYGLQFTRIEFDQKRAIREYVCAKTAQEEEI